MKLSTRQATVICVVTLVAISAVILSRFSEHIELETQVNPQSQLSTKVPAGEHPCTEQARLLSAHPETSPNTTFAFQGKKTLPANPGKTTSQQGNSPTARPLVEVAYAGRPPIRFLNNELILHFARGVSVHQAEQILANHNLTAPNLRETLARLRYVKAVIPRHQDLTTMLYEIAKERLILKSEPNYVLGTMEQQDPYYPQQDYARVVDFPAAWPALRAQGSVIVAIIDTGIDSSHPDLQQNILTGRNFVNNSAPPNDDHGHGTFLAGIVAASWNSVGIRGLYPKAKILPLKSIAADGLGTAEDTANAIVYAAEAGASVLCISAGTYAPSAILSEAIDYALERNCIIIAAAGNDAVQAPMFPASFPNVLSVGACDSTRSIAQFSNTGKYLDVFAPGQDLLSLAPQAQYTRASGTSGSAAIVTALGALLRVERSELSPYAVTRVIVESAEKLKSDSNAGLVNALRALSYPVLDYHDLSIRRISVEPPTVEEGSPIYTTVTIDNIGSYPRENCEVILMLLSDTGPLELGRSRLQVDRTAICVFEHDLPVDGTNLSIEASLVAPLDQEGSNNVRQTPVFYLRFGDDLHVLYSVEPPVHQWLAVQAWKHLSSGDLKDELQKYLMAGSTSDNDDHLSLTWKANDCWYSNADAPCQVSQALIEGVWEEDRKGIEFGGCRCRNHFWDPSCGYTCGWSGFLSAPQRAEQYYQNAIDNYVQNRGIAYYWLGRAAHLLEDLSVPAHVHLDTHIGDRLGGEDNFEVYMGSSTTATSPIYKQYGRTSSTPTVHYNNLADYPGKSTSRYRHLIRIFYSLASKSERHDSDGYAGTEENGQFNSYKASVTLQNAFDRVTQVIWYKQTRGGDINTAQSQVTLTRHARNLGYAYDIVRNRVYLTDDVGQNDNFDECGFGEGTYDVLRIRIGTDGGGGGFEDHCQVADHTTGLLEDDVPSSVFEKRCSQGGDHCDAQNAIAHVAALYQLIWDETHCDLTTAVSGNGAVSPSGRTEQVCNTSVQVCAQETDPCWRFDHWEDERGNNIGSSTCINIQMSGTRVVTAAFTKKRFSLTTNIVPAEAGRIDRSPTGTAYDCGTVVRLTAVPNTCWHFIGWNGDASGTNSTIDVLMDRNKTITANFERTKYRFTPCIVPEGAGIVDLPGGVLDCGTQFRICAKPNPCWRFVRWEVDAGGSNTCVDVTMDRDRRVCAVFEQITYQLTTQVLPSEAGSVTPASGPQACGALVRVVAKANPCWLFTGWTGDVGGNSSSVDVLMGSAKTVIANFTKVPPIVASFTTDPSPPVGCSPLKVCFKDLSTGTPTSWLWRFGDGAESTEQNPCHTYSVSGEYVVTLTAKNPCSSNPTTTKIVVKSPADAQFTSDVTTQCPNLPVCFTDLSQGESLKSWLWNFGDGKTSDQQNPCHPYEEPGTYSVKLTVTGECGSDTEEKRGYITIRSKPTAQFSFQPTQGCAPVLVSFKDESTGNPTAWHWDLGDGSISTEQHPRHTFQEPGRYVVVLKASNNCGEDSTQREITVCGPPIADLVIDRPTGCAPLTVCFTDKSTVCGATSWLWTLADGTVISQEQNLCYAFKTPGDYTITLCVKNACGEDCITKPVTVLAAHLVDFIVQPPVTCPGESACFTDQSQGENLHDWVWDFGDGTSNQERNPCHVYEKAGSYTVCLSVTGTCGPVRKCKEALVLVREPVTAALSFLPETGCAPLEVQFADESTGHNILSWEWDFGDSSPINTEQNPKHIYQEAGKYSVTLQVTNGCGPATASKDILVHGPPSPPAAILNETQAKDGELITLHWTEVDGATKYFVEARVIDITDSIPVCEVLASETSCEVCLDTSGVWQFSVSTESACGRGSPRESDTVEVLPAALIVYWPLDNCTAKAVLEGCANFIDPKEQDGVIFGRVACELDRFTRERSALQFDGLGQIRGTGLPENVNDFSLETWVRPSTCVSDDHGEGFVIIDNEDAGTSSTGTWKESEAANPYGGSSLFSTESGASYIFETAISGLYEVSLWWTTTSKRCEQVPIQLFNGNAPLETIYVNQRAGGGTWHRLNVYTFTSNATVTISSIGECSTSADAVRFARVDGPDSADAVTILRLYPTQDQAGAPVHFGWSPDKNSFSFANTSGSLETMEFLTEQWHHLLATRKDGRISFYIDGELAGEKPGDLTVLGSNFSFGGSETNAELCGALDAIRYTRESTAGSRAIDLILAGGPSAYLFPREAGKGTVRIGTRADALTMRLRTSPLQSNEPFELGGFRIVALDLTEGDASSLPSPLDNLEQGDLTLRSADGEQLLGKLAKGPLAPKRVEFKLEPSPNSLIPSDAEVELVALFFLKPETPAGSSLQFKIESCDDIQLSTGDAKAYIAGRRRIDKPAVEGDVLIVSVCDQLRFSDCPPNGKELVPYDTTLIAGGGFGAYTWRIVDGTLPQGLALDGNSGRIFGTPAAGTTGEYSVCFEVSDSCPSSNQSLVHCCTIEIERPEQGHLDLVEGKITRKSGKFVWTFRMSGNLETNFGSYDRSCTGGAEIMAILSWEGQSGLKYLESSKRKIAFKPKSGTFANKLTVKDGKNKLVLNFSKRQFTLTLTGVTGFDPFASGMREKQIKVVIPIAAINIDMNMHFNFTRSSKKILLLPAEEHLTTPITIQSNLCEK